MRRVGLVRDKAKNPKKRRPKPYERMTRPSERFQIDVKYVPAACVKGEVRGNGWFQYTALDEYSRWRYVMASEEHNTQASKRFLERLSIIFPCKIECVQTDNGSELTNRFTSNKGGLTAFELALAKLEIRHKLIRPYTPRHNGKVERSHRKDNERFYALNSFSSFKDFKQKLKAYNIKDYNCFPMRPLNWKSPQQVLLHFLRNESVRNV
jgi:transposase InsO family protein